MVTWWIFCNDNNDMIDGKKIKRIFECNSYEQANLIHFNLSLCKKKLKLSHAYITKMFPSSYKTGKFVVYVHNSSTNPEFYTESIPYLDLSRGKRKLFVPTKS